MNTQSLKSLIKANGFTQEEFSAKIGIHDSKLSRIISGQDEGSFAVFAKIVEGLDLDPVKAYELLLDKKYEKPFPDMETGAISLIKSLQADIADLQRDMVELRRDRDKVVRWVEGFGKS